MRKTIARLTFCLALGLLYNASSNISYAEELIAKTELNRAGEKITAELWANPIKGGYMNDLTVIFKNEDKHILTAYNPTISGGYNCFLKSVNVIGKDADEQLLLSIGNGTWTVPSSYYILDYDKKGNVKEVFGAKENLGLIMNAEPRDKYIDILIKDGEKNEVDINKSLSDVDKKRLNFDGIYSLVSYDFDNDGIDELFLDQEIRIHRDLLLDVGYMLKYDKDSEKWKESKITLSTNKNVEKNNTINEGLVFGGGMFLPRKIVLPFGEATYPEFSGESIDADNKVNCILRKEVETYLPQVFAGTVDLGFNVVRADEKLLSVDLISSKKDVRHHYINIEPRTYEVLKLSSVLNLKDNKLIPALNKISAENNLGFKGAIPKEWYILKNNLCLVQRNEEDKDQVISFPLEKLENFLKDKNWLPEKPKEDAKEKDEKAKSEKESFWDKLRRFDKKEENNSQKSAQKAEESSSKDKTK